ncbi:MAG: ABC transporter ATP-binding protein, partial [Bacillus sp. (in: firmicutes)]
DAKLRAALKNETGDSTVLIVAQRVSTIMDADQIIVLDNGVITGIGKHKDLMESSAVYREIVMSQLSEEEIA